MIKEQHEKCIITLFTSLFISDHNAKKLLLFAIIAYNIARNKIAYQKFRNRKFKEFKEIDMEVCTCHYFDDLININDLDLDDILLNKKQYGNALFYDVV